VAQQCLLEVQASYLKTAQNTHLSLQGCIYGMFIESTRVILSRLQKEMRRILVVQA